jgi:hypothetical protein
LEQDLNANVNDEDTSSQDSFVDATQMDGQIVVAQNQDQPLNVESAGQFPIPDRVVQDMAFLKQSWANMVDAEEESRKLLEDTDQGVDEEGFQLQISKNQKRAQKKLKQLSRDTYSTRSKVPPKPFK